MPNSSLSLTGKQWNLLQTNPTEDILSSLLTLREIQSPTAFLHPDLSALPSLTTLQHADRLLTRLKQAVQNKERILIFGDYDVDGITSSSILYQALQALGAEVSVRLPHRIDHGYGIRKKTLDECQKLNVKVLLTVDCGITALEEVKHGNTLGIDTLILDHHTCPSELPPAFAIVNPHQPSCTYSTKHLTAAGLSFRLAQELLKDEAETTHLLSYFASLAALGTVADCAPLLDENRLIVAAGLSALRNNPHPALQSLAELAGVNLKEINADDIGFRLAPRINAAGRLDDPHLAFDLLRGQLNNAEVLHKLNQTRQEITHKSVQEAEQLLSSKPSAPLVFLYKADWHPGILGLIAGRLAEQTGLPTFISSQKPNGEVVGSARTPHAFNAATALRSSAPLLTHFGGHHEAAGFSLLPENLSALETELINYAKALNHSLPIPTLDLDLPLLPAQLQPTLWDTLEQLEPCGIGNEKPSFLLSAVQIHSITALGKEGKHLRLMLKLNDSLTPALAWNLGHLSQKITTARSYDLAVRLRKNLFRDKISYEFELLDLV